MKSTGLWLAGLLLLAPGLAAQPSDLYPRKAAHTTTVAAPIVVDTSQQWDGNDGQWTSFILRVGKPTEQIIRVFPSTKSSAIWSIGIEGCPDDWYSSTAQDADRVRDCADNRGGFFLRNQSLTWTQSGLYQLHVDANLGYSDANGYFGFDTVSIGWQGANNATTEHQVVVDMATQDFWSGVFPLNPRPVNLSDSGGDPQNSLLQSLKNNKAIPSLSWGFTSGAKYRSENLFGSLVLGGYDQARFNKDSAIAVPFASDQEKDLTVRLNSITTNVSDSLLSQAIDVVIDSTIADMYLPPSVCEQFEKTFNLVYNSSSGFYYINDTQYNSLLAQGANITFDIGVEKNKTQISFPLSAFLQEISFPHIASNKSAHYFPIVKMNDSSQYTLGRVFLQEAYLIYDYERSNFTLAPVTWPASGSFEQSLVAISSTNSSGSSSTNGGHSLSAGAIAGAVIGGVVAGLLIAALVFCLYTRRKQRRRRESIKSGSVAAHSRHGSAGSSLPSAGGGRPRAGSRIASWLRRNPWASDADTVVPGLVELDIDPKALTLAEHEARKAAQEQLHKRHPSELDGQTTGVHEMYQPKHELPEVEGDIPFPTYVSSTYGGSSTGGGGGMSPVERHGGAEPTTAAAAAAAAPAAQNRGLYEMDGTSVNLNPSPLPSPPLPSPGQLEAVARKEREEEERLAAERSHAERVREAERRESLGAGPAGDPTRGVEVASSAGGGGEDGEEDRPDMDRRVSDLSPISESSDYARHIRPDAERRVSRD